MNDSIIFISWLQTAKPEFLHLPILWNFEILFEKKVYESAVYDKEINESKFPAQKIAFLVIGVGHYN